jgi:tagatose-1,6-bisphosphate aldolase
MGNAFREVATMAAWAKFADGGEVNESQFRLLAKYAPDGTLDVFASDQHGSYLKLAQGFLEQMGAPRKATDEDVAEICTRFARELKGLPSAALFNHLAYMDPAFREALGEKTILIGRLEDTYTKPLDGGKGQLAQLTKTPEEAADKVDGFKTLVKLDPDHRESWKRNQEWLADVFERCNKAGKPLFNETLIFARPGESNIQMAQRLPEAVVRMAEDFSPFGTIYKTQVPVLWAEDTDKTLKRVSSPDVIRKATQDMFKLVNRPMLLLSAAVDFEQYAAQYALVCDLIAGPMCGRAYFKEAFKDARYKAEYEKTKQIPWTMLEENFAKIALPRMKQIKGLARAMSQAWWHKFTWMAPEAKALVQMDAKPKSGGVKGDFGY